MKFTSLLAVVVVFSTPVFGQKVGPYVTAGGGISVLHVSPFSVTNPVAVAANGEVLNARGRRSNVSVARLTAGYNFTENWSLQISYAKFGKGEVEMAFPEYPDVVWATGSGPDKYQRHALVYKPTTISLMPVYTHAVSDDSRIIFGAGVTKSKISSHFESIYMSGAVVNPALLYRSNTYAEESESKMTPAVLIGIDKKISNNFSIGFTCTYTSLKMKIPSSPWATRSAETVGVNSFEANLYLGWHL
ncbi:MAG: outer membrane beta-barrel protein [Nibricoccus sp.]